MAIKYIPDGVHTITPFLTVSDAAALFDFILRGLDNVKTIHEMKGADGTIWHADLKIGDSHLMLGQARKPEDAVQSMLYLYVPDCDAAFRKALAAGGTVHSEVQTQFYGDRHGCVKDPCGNQWWFATHVEDVSPEELERRATVARG
jgi:PhnB protein